MILERAIFIILSVVTVGTGIIVVTNKNIFHAALAMMTSFLGVAGLYVTLDAGFLAAAQLLVYIGAISILVIFAIMMTRRLMQARETPFNSQAVLGLITAVGSFVLIVAVVTQYWPTTPAADVLFAGRPPVADSVLQGSVVELGRVFVSANGYVLPFEIASVLLLAAMIGAIVIAWPQAEEEEA